MHRLTEIVFTAKYDNGEEKQVKIKNLEYLDKDIALSYARDLSEILERLESEVSKPKKVKEKRKLKDEIESLKEQIEQKKEELKNV